MIRVPLKRTKSKHMKYHMIKTVHLGDAVCYLVIMEINACDFLDSYLFSFLKKYNVVKSQNCLGCCYDITSL